MVVGALQILLHFYKKSRLAIGGSIAGAGVGFGGYTGTGYLGGLGTSIAITLGMRGLVKH